MGISVFVAEKKSVAAEFAGVLGAGKKTVSRQGYFETDNAVITWCIGHLVTMSYPEVYDPSLKRWREETLPFLPETFLYEVISQPSVRKQFQIVSGILKRDDVDTIYVCTDSGREGEYIYRLVEQQVNPVCKDRRRVWIDSQTEEEIKRGIREAKPLSDYDNLSASAFLRAKEDYLMGINFSRILTLKYGQLLAGMLNKKYAVVSVGRVMTCVLGMVVRREREIRDFVKTPFYRVLMKTGKLEAEWRAVEGSSYAGSPLLYKENGFLKKEDAGQLIRHMQSDRQEPDVCVLESVEKKKEKKNPPLLFNLAELQNECSKRFKISPDETLKIVQELYEKKMVTYPRTDARVLSSAVAKEIGKNLGGLEQYEPAVPFLEKIKQSGTYKKLAKTRYVNDSQITDHYAIIPTGQGHKARAGLSSLSLDVYDLIVRRFLAIFYPPAEYLKWNITLLYKGERFFASGRLLANEGYMSVSGKEQKDDSQAMEQATAVASLRKGSKLPVEGFSIREGETTPPKRYNSGSLILAMENAGQLIEDEELRSQIKGSGIGTSATRAEILNKLIHIEYLQLNKKTQVITPTLMGELVFDVVNHSIRALLNPELTASWEKGLTFVAEGTVSNEEYMDTLKNFISGQTNAVKMLRNQSTVYGCYEKTKPFYKNPVSKTYKKRAKTSAGREKTEKT